LRGAVAAGLLLLAACGGGDQTTSGAIATSPPQQSATGGTPSGTTSPTAGPTAAGGVRTVLAPLGLNLRADHSTQSAVLGMLGQGTVLTVLAHIDTDGGWYQVKGATKTGWITDDPRFSSPRQFTTYSSDARGFSVLYPNSWTFSETAGMVGFQPQAGGSDLITVVQAATLDALGQPGRPGYNLRDTRSVEVFGVTGVLRFYSRSGAASGAPATAAPATAAVGGTPGAAATPAPVTTPPPGSTQLAEIRLAVDPAHAMRIDFDYANTDDLAIFTDFYDSMLILAAARTPTAAPAASPTPSH